MRKKQFQYEIFKCVFDASSLINIEREGKMNALRKHKGAVLIPEKVAGEINQPKSPLHGFITKYPETVISFQANEEDRYLQIRSQVGIHDGEASAIAIALNRGLSLVIDERETKATGKAKNHGVKTLSWRDFLKGNI